MKRVLRKLARYFSLIFAFAGMFIMVIPSLPILGAVIGIKEMDVSIYFFVGLGLLIIGFMLSLAPLTKIVQIEMTRKFEKAIKGRNREQILRALDKLQTGLANEKYLWLTRDYSIRVDKGGRIHYQRKSDGTIVLTDYVPSSEHK